MGGVHTATAAGLSAHNSTSIEKQYPTNGAVRSTAGGFLAEVTRQEPNTSTAGPFPQPTTSLQLPRLEVGGDVSKIAVVFTTPKGDFRLAFDLTDRQAT